MLRLPHFQYEAPRETDEAVALLARYGPDALPVSGGTDLYANMKQGLFTPQVIVALGHIRDLRFIRYDNRHGLHIGALTTLRALAAHDAVRSRYRALALAAESISTPQLRSMGTVGGNICLDTRCFYYNQNADWREALGYCLKKDGDICRVATSSTRCLAVNSSDLAPALQAFDATVHIASAGGRRLVRMADFYGDDGRRAAILEPGEIVTAITIPAPRAQTRSVYRKLRLRDSFDFPLAGVAAVVQFDGDGVCSDACVVLNAVGPRPVEVARARDALVGTRLEPDALAYAADSAFAAGKPMENAATSLLYRKRMLRVFARRALGDLTIATL